MKPALARLSALVVALAVAPNALASQPGVVARASRSVVLVVAGDTQGSAFAFGRPGHYITNAHVVRGVDDVVLVGPHRRRFHAVVVSRDERTDVAELRASVALPALNAAREAPLPGDQVLTIGAASGLTGTVTEGIVSAVGRNVGGVRMIQTDAAVNPGSSGGVLLDAQGRVLGITTSLERDTQGIAFAIPIATAERAVARPPSIRAAPIHRSQGGLGVAWLAGISGFGVLVLCSAAFLVKRQIDERNARPSPEVVVRSRTDLVSDPLVIVRRSRTSEPEPVARGAREPSSIETEA